MRKPLHPSSFKGNKQRKFLGMEYLRRLFNRSQMDFEYALWQMSRLCISPSQVYLSTKTRKEIKGKWARDDPAFIVILLILMLISNIIHTIIFGEKRFLNFIAVILETIFFDFMFISGILSIIYWIISNKYLIDSNNNNNNSVSQITNLISNELNNRYNFDGNNIELGYSFDIHCNSYFIYFIINNIIVLILSPILLRQNTLSLILGNSISLFAFISYFYISFLGYNGMFI